MLATQNEVRNGLLTRLAQARAETDRLFEVVRPDSLYERPIPERHRIVFYLGHLEAFDWNLLRDAAGLRAFHPEFDRLFAFGIDPVGGGLPSDGPADWPALAPIHEYNRQVRQALDAAFEHGLAGSATLTSGGYFSATLLNAALEHRLMHAETLAYLLHRLPLDRKVKPPCAAFGPVSPAAPRAVEIPAGSATLGLARGESEAFGWDNEYETHKVTVPAFTIGQRKITNGQYLAFLNRGGYADRAWWTEAGWQWRSGQNVTRPAFWTQAGERWMYRTMFDEIPLPLDWPVYVSHAEASAYARWAGKSLPTEAEWHRAAYGTREGEERPYPWGEQPPERSMNGNFDFLSWDPAPVNAFPAGRSAFGVQDLVGNGWEWTSTVFEPFPGFQPFPFYPGYSANFFDGQHYVMKGGSARTAACMLRRSFRNWFQPHYPYVYAGFRCVCH
ncbi:MAG TPA: SUMF1/EgtB/PvdO family nonheme iron enzyme [Terriglobia bacterium]|nr:SUMF1/EgtB/PvdO family nonheme iron enzyme [Terriglobia bacterium]